MITIPHSTPTVALHTDDPIARAGIAAQLAQQRIALADRDDSLPDVAVVVSDVVDDHVQQLVRKLRRSGVHGLVLVVAHLDDRSLFAAIEAGATGLLRRTETTPERLAAAICDAKAGHGVMPPDLVGRLISQVRDLHDHVLAPRGMHLAGLSVREVDVLRLVADGLGTPEIADKLAYSERTIKNIIQGVTTRLQLRNRSHAVAYALRHGLI